MMDIDDHVKKEVASNSLYHVFHQFKSKQLLAGGTKSNTIIDVGESNGQLHLSTDVDLAAYLSTKVDEVHKDSATQSITDSRKQPRRDDANGVHVILPNTGRVVFASSIDDVSELFRVAGKDVNAEKRQKRQDERLDTSSLRKLKDLSLKAGNNENPASSKASAVKSGPANSTSKDQAYTTSKNPNLPVTVPGTKPSPNVARSVATARMAAQGEEWPEEEDLPGFRSNASAEGQVTQNV